MLLLPVLLLPIRNQRLLRTLFVLLWLADLRAGVQVFSGPFEALPEGAWGALGPMTPLELPSGP